MGSCTKLHRLLSASMASNPSLERHNVSRNVKDDDSEKYREIISTLPICPSESTFRQYEGFWCFHSILEGVMSAQDHFKAQPPDIFLCSFPKAGSTWLRSLAFAIATRGRYEDEDSSNPLFTESPHEFVPCLESGTVNYCDPDLPIMATHIPYTSLPPSIISSSSKLVYICRDPKDVLVSSYHFFRKVPHIGKKFQLNGVYEMFCDGHMNFGPYWDHALGYWKASLANPEKVLFLRYEEMKKDTVRNVKRLAYFMGYPFSLEEERSGEAKKIARKCSFESLSNLNSNKTGMVDGSSSITLKRDSFFRKGEVGDWKNHLNDEMAARLDKIFEEKLGPFGLSLCA